MEENKDVWIYFVELLIKQSKHDQVDKICGDALKKNRKFKEAWYRLSPAERNEINDKSLEKHKELGIKMPFMCNCYLFCEEWSAFIVEEHPDIETLQKYEEYLIEIGWQRYVESKFYLGTRVTAEEMMKYSTMNY